MAVDKLVDSTQLDSDLTSVANAIRAKGGTSASLEFPVDFVNAIDAIETGGGGGIVIEDTLDSHGGVIRTITAVPVKLQTTSVTPSETAQTVVPDTSQGYTGLEEVDVAAIPSQYIVPSGNKAITENGNNIDVAAYSTVSVNVAASGKAVQIASGVGRVAGTTYATTGVSLTVGKTGTYDIYWVGYRSSTSGTNGTRLYVDDSAHSSGEQTSFNGTYTNVQLVHLSNVSLTKDQVLTVYAKSRGTQYQMYAMNLVIIEA